MKAFREISARFAQTVCLLTHDNLGTRKSCTISSYNPISTSINSGIFSFSLTRDSFMAGNIEENSKVQVTLLNYNQSNIAEFYAKNRSDSDRINIENVAAESIGFIKGKVFKSIPVGSSVLYLSEVENIEFCSLDLRPLVYRLRNYE